MKAQALPNEILGQIFELVPRQSVYQCLYVSKAWNTAALEQFYKQVSLNGKMITNLKTLLASTENTSEKQVVTHGELVRYLSFDADDSSQVLTKEEVSTLLSHLSRLKKIGLTKSQSKGIYLEAIHK